MHYSLHLNLSSVDLRNVANRLCHTCVFITIADSLSYNVTEKMNRLIFSLITQTTSSSSFLTLTLCAQNFVTSFVYSNLHNVEEEKKNFTIKNF